MSRIAVSFRHVLRQATRAVRPASTMRIRHVALSLADVLIGHLGVPGAITGCNLVVSQWRHRVHERAARAVNASDAHALDSKRS